MTGRSTSIPGIAIGAGVIAAAAIIPASDGAVCSSSANDLVTDQRVFASNWGRGELKSSAESITKNSLSFPVDEEWEDEKHKPELQKLVVKKATSKVGLTEKEAVRLVVLQRMRRDAMPLPTSYETFIRERERLAELKRLTDALMEYERKYGRS